MRRILLLLLLLLADLPLAGCAPAVVVPDEDRLRVTRELTGRRRWFKVAVNLGPFFGDRSKRFASDQPFSEVDLLESPGGKTILPPPAERILLPGTPAVVREVEFPTLSSSQAISWTIARRPVLTPRTLVWAYLDVPGVDQPVVLVLPPSVARFEDVKVELDRYLGNADPTPELQALPEGQRRAIARKEIAEGMGPAAATMAWGYPEKRIVDRPSAREQWIWPGAKRRAWFEDDRVVRFEPRG
jgi:hypothetical protein